ncbi:alkaline phosphatase D family protein [Alteraurantiacibacter aquimixticola]|uniref:alkaline phosphatase D family protein n=1 Tax=Alteraurantiacibacter aquimixticola TaxID=2489173 RepID=UPI001FE6EDBA|nr:alkaline phosphatase D family protein [Alteraurantiacibacter aquimixticola]
MSRRQLLRRFGAGAVTLMGLSLARPVIAQPFFTSYPFQLGIASGEPAADGFVIWTRLAPDPLEMGHGMPAAAVPVDWQVATDPGMRQVVASGSSLARPELGHAVHVEVGGLEPARPYWYQFSCGSERSGRGRAMTTPVAGQPLDRARFAVGGCQRYEDGYYTAWREMARTEPDFVFCYGDYIYEYRGERLRQTWDGPVERVREHFGDELYSLDDYRRRYAQHKMDPDLQAAHAAAPWFVTFDDHEIDNNWADMFDQDGTPPAFFALRRQMAMQAYYEHMPLRASSLPTGPSMQMYRQARYGDLLALNLLDTRQYRSDQSCDDRWGVPCDSVNRADAQMLGTAQEDWLEARLAEGGATWQAIAQQVMVMDLDRLPGEGRAENLDSWAGYGAPRRRLLEGIERHVAGRTVVLTGDEHQNFAGELSTGDEPIAAEFVVTSITSGGDGEPSRSDTEAIAAENPQLRWHNAQRGFALCDVTHRSWTTDFMVMDYVTRRGGTSSLARRFELEPGNARLPAG